MTAMSMIYLASIAGAVLFFVAGAAAMALYRPAAAARDDAEAERLRQALAVAEASVRDHRAALASAAPPTQPAPTRPGKPHEPAFENLRARCERAESERDQLEHQARRAASELREHRERVEHAIAERDQASARAGQLASELDRVRTEITAAAGELEHGQARARDLERQLAERTHTVRDLATENEQLKGRIRDAEGLRGEYVRLRTAAVETEFLKGEVTRLEEEVRRLKMEQLGSRALPRVPRPPRQASAPPTTPASGTISESLARVLERFTDASTHSVALADNLGFPLASTGNDGLALAAFATMLVEPATRASQFVPFSRPQAVEVIDERGARIAVWPFDVAGDRLLLASLAVSPVDQGRVEATIASLAAILEPSAIAS
jgi:hypothetical protein